MFEVIRFDGLPEGGAVSATLYERHDGLDIIRKANLFEENDPAALTLGGGGAHPRTATVAPGAPFLGSATFTAAPAPGAVEWEGSLSVPLPGAGIVSLAGKGFSAIACRSRTFDKVDDCLFRRAPG